MLGSRGFGGESARKHPTDVAVGRCLGPAPRQRAGGGPPPPPLPARRGGRPLRSVPPAPVQGIWFPPIPRANSPSPAAWSSWEKPPSRPPGGLQRGRSCRSGCQPGGPISSARRKQRRGRFGGVFQLCGCTAHTQPTPEREERRRRRRVTRPADVAQAPRRSSAVAAPSNSQQPSGERKTPPQLPLLCRRPPCQPSVQRWSPCHPQDKGGHKAQAGQTAEEPQQGILFLLLLLLCRPCRPLSPVTALRG